MDSSLRLDYAPAMASTQLDKQVGLVPSSYIFFLLKPNFLFLLYNAPISNIVVGAIRQVTEKHRVSIHGYIY